MNTRFVRLILAICLLVLPALLAGQAQTGPLAALLNPRELSPVPNSLSFYRPGALIVVRAGHDPDYRDPTAAVEEMTLKPANGLIPQLNLVNAQSLGVAAVLFGFSPAATFDHHTSLVANSMQLLGWRLSSEDVSAIKQQGSSTYTAAHEEWVHPPLHGRTRIYLIDSVFTTTDASISTTDGTQLTLTSGDPTKCDNPNGPQPEAAPGAATPKQAPNAKVADLPKAVAQGALHTAQAATPGGSVKFCRTGASSMSFSSVNPVPIAMVVRRVTFLQDGSMRADPETVRW